MDEIVRQWILGGRQVGRSLTVRRDGRSWYLRVAIQRLGDGFTVLVDEIDEACLDAEIYARDERRSFPTLDEAAAFVEGTTPVTVAELRPSRGQKWF
jgi:hypothetical protein